MWADPRTCLTHRRSGLPSNRRVEAYCYAPPCLVDLRLSKLAASSSLITSFVYSHDVVSRLSLGSVRDLRRAASWLSEAESERRGEGYGGVTGRALKAKTGFGKADDPQWVRTSFGFQLSAFDIPENSSWLSARLWKPTCTWRISILPVVCYGLFEMATSIRHISSMRLG